MDVDVALVSRMFLKGLRVVGLLIAVSLLFSTSQAALIYTFYGQIPLESPSLTDTHPRVSPGETWTATLKVNETTPGNYAGRYYTYNGAVISGTLAFSGGYVSPIKFEQFRILVDGDFENFDLITVWGYASEGTERVDIAAVTDRNPWTSGQMPGPGAKLVPYLSDDPTEWWVFNFMDGLGEVSYRGLYGAVGFTATIPEPASLALASLLGGSLVLARSRR